MITLKCDCGSWDIIISHGIINCYICKDCGAFYQEHSMKKLSLEDIEKMYERETGKSLNIPENRKEFQKLINFK